MTTDDIQIDIAKDTSSLDQEVEDEGLFCSYSPAAPFAVLFEDDGEAGYVYAARLDAQQNADVEDLVELYQHHSEFLLPFQMPQDLNVVWSKNGEKAAVLIQETFHVVFDFATSRTYAKSLDVPEESGWSRLQFEYRADIVGDFEYALSPEPKALLEKAISKGSIEENESNRLSLYKALMKSTVFVPISSDEADITHNYLVFPQDDDKIVLGVFTELDTLKEILGEDVHFKSIACSSLFRLLQGRDVAAVIITNTTQDTVVIDASEFSLLSFATNINQLNYSETVRSLATIMLKEPDIEVTHPIFEDLKTLMADYDDLKEAFVFQSSAEESTVTLGLILTKREERRLVAFYKEFRALNKKYFQEDDKIELSVLKDGEHLLHAVREKTEPIYQK